MRKKISLIAMDVDGTLLGKNKILSARTKTVLAKAAAGGVHLVVASGRAVQAIPSDLLNIDGVKYAITSNGSSIFSVEERKRIYRRDLTESQIHKLMNFYREYDCPMEVFIQGCPYTSQDYYNEPEKFGASPSSAEYVRTTRHPVEDIREFVMAHVNEIEGINFIVYDKILKAEMRSRLESFGGFYVTSSVARYIEISHADVCKRSALEWLAEQLGISQKEIIAFGDGENDLEMIQYAGMGVAMGNGIDMLKKAADIVAPACEEDGVARVLENILEL